METYQKIRRWRVQLFFILCLQMFFTNNLYAVCRNVYDGFGTFQFPYSSPTFQTQEGFCEWMVGQHNAHFGGTFINSRIAHAQTSFFICIIDWRHPALGNLTDFYYFKSSCDANRYVIDLTYTPETVENKQTSCQSIGNPVNPADGRKFLTQTDFVDSANSLSDFTRYYDSRRTFDGKLGAGWSAFTSRKITTNLNTKYGASTVTQSSSYTTKSAACVSGWEDVRSQITRYDASQTQPVFEKDTCHIYQGTTIIDRFPIRDINNEREIADSSVQVVHRPDGITYWFKYDTVTGKWEAEGDVALELTALVDGWEITTPRNEIEHYNANGQLLSSTDEKGNTQQFFYTSEGDLTRITTNTGKQLLFKYYQSGQALGKLESITALDGRVWRYEYDSEGNMTTVHNPDTTFKQYHYEDSRFPHALTGITDERNVRFANYTYDDQKRVVTSTRANDVQRIDLTYNTNGTTTIKNSRLDTSTYSFAVQAGVSLIAQVDGPGCTLCADSDTTYQYDKNNNVISRTENGVTTQFGDYDANGNPGYRIDAAGTPEARHIDFTYDPRFYSKVKMRSEPSVCVDQHKVTTNTYDDFGYLTQTTIAGFTPAPACTPISRTTRFEYNGPLNQLSLMDGPRTDVNDITTYSYYPNDITQGNNRGRLQRVVMQSDVDNAITFRDNIEYSATGKILKETRPNGLQLVYTYYSGNDRLETLSETDGSNVRTTRWTYLPTGEVETITLGVNTLAATSLTFTYDAARRLIGIRDGLGNTVQYTLDTEGNRIAEEFHDASGTLQYQFKQTFDIYNRLDTTAQLNQITNNDFAADGTLSLFSDGKGSQTGYQYDALLRLTQTIQDQNGTNPNTASALTQYKYDTQDNLTQIIDASGGVTRYVYDDLGNLLQRTSADTGTTVFSYDEAGNVLTELNGNGKLLSYQYDALNRITLVDAVADKDDVIYQYDNCINGLGLICSILQDGQLVDYQYNNFGDVSIYQGMAYQYDASGRLLRLVYPGGHTLQYDYDAANQVTRVTFDDGQHVTELASNIAYIPFGPIAQLTYGNGAHLNQSYDQAYRMTSQSVPSVFQRDYVNYDANGNVQRISGDSTYDYQYDAFDRIIQEGASTYAYDKNSNRTEYDEAGQLTRYMYTPNSNRLSDINTTAITLDSNGNTLKDQRHTYTYNQHNRLVAVNTNIQYRYNGLGQRVEKNVGGVITQYRYGRDGELLAELDAQGNMLREYYWLNGQVIATYHANTVPTNSPTDYLLTGVDAQQPAVNYQVEVDLQARTLHITNDNGLDWQTTEITRWREITDTNSLRIIFDYNPNRDEDVSGDIHFIVGEIPSALFTLSFGQVVSNARVNVHSNQSLLALPGQPLPMSQDGDIYYVHNDQLGTPRALSDAQRRVVWRWDSDAFGRTLPDEDADNDGINVTMPLRFLGQYFDTETGLHYNYYRYYDPRLGRYITSDLIGLLGGLNTYGYGFQNPNQFIDQFGLDARTILGRTGEVTAFNQVVANGEIALTQPFQFKGGADFITFDPSCNTIKNYDNKASSTGNTVNRAAGLTRTQKNLQRASLGINDAVAQGRMTPQQAVQARQALAQGRVSNIITNATTSPNPAREGSRLAGRGIEFKNMNNSSSRSGVRVSAGAEGGGAASSRTRGIGGVGGGCNKAKNCLMR